VRKGGGVEIGEGGKRRRKVGRDRGGGEGGRVKGGEGGGGGRGEGREGGGEEIPQREAHERRGGLPQPDAKGENRHNNAKGKEEKMPIDGRKAEKKGARPDLGPRTVGRHGGGLN